jgi:hypothetical protein
VLTALVVSSLALADSEVGTKRKFGIGAEFGSGTYLNVSGKYWLGEKPGIAFHAGTSFIYHEVGARFEDTFYEGQWFDWADMPFYWWAGVDLGLYSYLGYSAPQVGVSGGAAAALQFTGFPGEAFVQAGLGLYPLNYCSGLGGLGAACLVQGRGTAGFRYYF